jgi:hypothetical protein
MTATAMVPVANGKVNGAPQVPKISWRSATIKKQALLPTYNIPSALGGKTTWTIDSKGFIAGVDLTFNGSATISTGDAGAKADWPWSIINRIRFADSGAGNGKNLTGYNAYLAARYFQPWYGRDQANPRNVGDAAVDARIYAASVATAGTQQQRYTVPLPVECHTRDGLAVLPNQNASFVYSLDVDFEAPANLFTTPANFAGAITAQPVYDYYTVPSPVRGDGAQVEVLPPFIGVVRRTFDERMLVPSANENRYKITTGNVCRGFVLVTRNSSGDRVNGFSRLKLFYGDDTAMFELSEQQFLNRWYRLSGETPPVGVYPVLFTMDADMIPNNDFQRDYLDTRNLAQLYFSLTTVAGVSTIDVIHDELIVPPQISLSR